MKSQYKHDKKGIKYNFYHEKVNYGRSKQVDTTIVYYCYKKSNNMIMTTNWIKSL